MEALGKIALLNHKDDNVAAAIYAVFQESYRVESELLGVTDFPPLRRSSGDIKLVDTIFLAREDPDGLIGIIEVSQDKALLQISSLAVVPRLFRKGVGVSLVNYALSALPWEKAEVQTAARNIPAICLYQNAGFSERKRWMSKEGIEIVSLDRCRTC